MSDKLKRLVCEFQDVAAVLSKLSKKSKELRQQIAEQTSIEIKPVNEEEWIEFLLDEQLISVKKAKLCDDFTILYRSIPKV